MRDKLVYDWEGNYVEPRDGTILSRDACESLVTLACGYLGIKRPTIRFVKGSSAPCWANIVDWSLQIQQWGRSRITVLHEVAHLAAAAATFRGEDAHGPTFVACAIKLYAKFAEIDEDYLRSSALRCGLDIGIAPNASPRLGTFADIDF